MNAQPEPQGAEGPSADSAAQPSIAATESGDHGGPDSAPPEKESSELLRAMFYWALSRL